MTTIINQRVTNRLELDTTTFHRPLISLFDKMEMLERNIDMTCYYIGILHIRFSQLRITADNDVHITTNITGNEDK